jgi:D-alanyl-D-alanine carboxypeptidase
MIAEMAGGAKISALVRARTLVPAHLEATFFDGEEPLTGTLATGFDVNKKDVTRAVDLSGPWSAGAMVATGADLAEWITALYGGSVLDATSKQLLVAAPAHIRPGQDYGLGVVLLGALTPKTGTAMGHYGDIDGYNTAALYFASKQTAIVGIVNQDGASGNDLLLAALPVLFP